jgi:hypothetical protein
LAKGDNRTGTYYAAGQTLTVDGDVAGDVVCAAQTVVINGSVGGDVLCAGQNITVNGTVGGSVRAAGQLVAINNTVGRNVTVGAQNFVLGTNSKVSGEMALGAQMAAFNGPIEHAVYVAAESLSLKSTIGGNLDYYSENTFSVDKSKVSGTVTRHAAARTQPAPPTPAEKLAMLLFWLASALLGALAIIWLAPRMVRTVTGTMIQRWQASLGWGLVGLFGLPFLLIILAFSVIGLPTAAVIAVLWVIALVTSGLFTGTAIGRRVWQREETGRKGLLQSAVVGIPLVILVCWLPVIGGIAGMASAIWALGGIMLALNQSRTTN